MADDALVRELLGAAKAYTQHYGVPESAEQMQGIVSSLLRLKVQGSAIALSAKAAEALIEQVIEAFNGQAMADLVVSAAQEALAQQVYHWQESLTTQIKETLSAYVQRFAPNKTVDNLSSTIETIIPLLQDGHLTRSEVMTLVWKIASTFGVEAALTHVIKPEYLQLAQELALCMAQKPMEKAVEETVLAYLKKHQPEQEAISEGLIENAISAISNLPIEFSWDTELNLKDKRLLIKQVAFKLNILKADPILSGPAEKAADQMHSEIERFRQERKASLGTVNVTWGLSSDDGLEISSAWKFTDSAKP